MNWKFGNDIDTDQIISSQYIMLPSVEEMKQYTFESLDPEFTRKVKKGDIIIGGRNFGCGSSREQAPIVLKELGIHSVIAVSFARIFFRNSINIGLPLIICPEIYNEVTPEDKLSVSFEKGEIECKGKNYYFNKYPEHLMKIIDSGGLIQYINNL
jgi:3-isopropylmalate/(R)-2-methylmalate dehydratase small subunit